jgi:hypothetical protein
MISGQKRVNSQDKEIAEFCVVSLRINEHPRLAA